MKKLFSLFLLASGITATAQPISESEKNALIDSVSKRLNKYYVFADKAGQMSDFLKKRSSEKAYATITDYKAFVQAIGKDIQQVHTDKHMSIMYNPEQVAKMKSFATMPQPTPEMMQQNRDWAKKMNHGFVKVERLPGNIGYVDFRQFFNVNPDSENTVAAAMNFISNSDAVIIDLRKNGGGDPAMVQVIFSYFMDTPVHYNTIYNRSANRSEKFLSLKNVKGNKMPTTDLYVLTSRQTFSGAEEFAYNVQSLKRGTLIGETTGGGAHPTSQYVINDQVIMAIPMARSVNAVTNTNWEGVGVVPEVKVPADKALMQAQLMIAQKLMAKSSNPAEKRMAEWQVQSLQAQINPVRIETKSQEEMAGSYGDRIITSENGSLYYQRGQGQKMKLIALEQNLFQPEGLDFFRVQFVRDAQGKIEKLVGHYDNGNKDESPRSSKSF